LGDPFFTNLGDPFFISAWYDMSIVTNSEISGGNIKVNESCIKVENLKKSYGSVQAVNGISFQVESGTIFGMLGPNGAGKSTTIEILTGLQPMDQGEIEILGQEVEKDSRPLKDRLGVQLQSPALFGKLNIRELVTLFASFYQDPLDPETVISMVGLEDKLKERTENLSGGQRHRLAVALAIVGNGDIIFLDEPTTGLDPQSRRKLWGVITELKELGKTIFLTTHYMDEAEILCDQLIIIDRGKIIASGRPDSLIAEHFTEDAIEFSNPSFTASQINGFKEFRGVTGVNLSSEDIVLLYTINAPETIADLMAFAEKDGKKIAGLKLRKASLDDLFLKLTGREIR